MDELPTEPPALEVPSDPVARDEDSGNSAGPPPEDSPPYATEVYGYARVGERAEMSLTAADPDGDDVTVTFEGLPAGVTYDPLFHELLWTPSDADIGEHRFAVVVSDGTHVERVPGKIFVDPPTWDGWLVPGIAWSAMRVGTSGSRGYRGPLVELVLWSSADPARGTGPSRARLYTNVGMMEPMSSAGGDRILRTGAGVDLSLEGEVARRWFLPYYGLEVEGLRVRQGVHAVRIDPHVGAWLYSGESLSVLASCGYGYAVTLVDAWSGPECTGSVQLSSW